MPDEVPQATERRSRRSRWTAGLLAASDYTDEEFQFLRAIEDFKREQRRPFPTWSEVLGVLLSLGYKKVSP